MTNHCKFDWQVVQKLARTCSNKYWDSVVNGGQKRKLRTRGGPQSLGFGTENCWKVFGSEMFRAQILTVFLHALLVKFKALMHFVLKMSTNPRTTFETFTHQSVHHVWCLEKVVLSSTKRFQDILAYILLIFSVCANILDLLGQNAKQNWSPSGLYLIQVHNITCVRFRFGRVWKCKTWKQMNQHVSTLGKTTKGLFTGANVMLHVWLVYSSYIWNHWSIFCELHFSIPTNTIKPRNWSEQWKNHKKCWFI